MNAVLLARAALDKHTYEGANRSRGKVSVINREMLIFLRTFVALLLPF